MWEVGDGRAQCCLGGAWELMSSGTELEVGRGKSALRKSGEEKKRAMGSDHLEREDAAGETTGEARSSERPQRMRQGC